MARPKPPLRALRAYLLVVATLAAFSGVHHVSFTAQSPDRRVRVRLAAFKPGDVVQLRNEGEWRDAVVDSEDAAGRIKVHFLADGHVYHEFPTRWRVPSRQVPRTSVTQELRTSVTQELEESSFQNGQKLQGKVCGKRPHGILVDVGLSTPQLVPTAWVPLGDLEEGQEVDVWVRRHRGRVVFSLVNVWKHTGLVGEWMNASVTRIEKNTIMVRGQTADGDCLPGALQHHELGGARPALGDALRVRLMSVNLERGRCEFSLLPSVDELPSVSPDEWLNGTVWRGPQPGYGFFVELAPPGTKSRRGLLHRTQIPHHLLLSRDLQPGEAVRVRILHVDPELGLSMLPVLPDLKKIPQEQWLRGHVEHVVPKHGCAVRVENPTGGDDIMGWLWRSQVSYGFTADMQVEVGQEVKVRIHQVEAGKVILSMRDPNALAAFHNVSEDAWMSAEVTEVYPEGLDVKVVSPEGGPSQEGFVTRTDIRQGIVSDATEEDIEVGETLNVRLIREALEEGDLNFSLKPKPNFSAFEALPGTKWLKGTVIEVGDEGVALVVPSPVAGGRPVDSFLSPAEMVQEKGEVTMGQQLEVRIRSVNARKGRLELTTKPTIMSSFKDIPHTQWFNGTVEQVARFGIFVRVEAPDGTSVKGLVHVSRMSTDFVREPSAVAKEGQVVRVCVVNVDTEKNQMELSMVPILKAA